MKSNGRGIQGTEEGENTKVNKITKERIIKLVNITVCERDDDEHHQCEELPGTEGAGQEMGKDAE